ncbi:ribose 5-phosphate isomerase B [Agriterribacter sp.]|uniref:ribose 5-phosphate isomerase B n=1 Tax=Agriterribacter sp. TaxID=2821509 RepID=UPI002CE07300|nr:ribose 5-phosphate isomerase B [Agriterribacter sp.]HTN06087.1 ribose 5-phosphate isomerase B [Agriterribacter sp.]
MSMLRSSFNLFQPIAIGCDHAGFVYKEEIVAQLKAEGFQLQDFGTHSKESVDYPDFAHPVANAVEQEEAAFGILLCGSGNGVAITANKHQHIRAAICWSVTVSKLARQHNDANIICIPGRFVSVELALEMIWKFIQTEFEGGRHAMRVDKIACV